MKTQISCPNKNDPAWEILVNAIGEVRSYIAFFRNENVIPDPTRARQLLKIGPDARPNPPPLAAPVETGTTTIQIRRADARKIKPGISATPRGSRHRSRARLQTRRVICK
jgi:hypothetical protein